MNASLVLVKDNGSLREATLKAERTVLGRDRSCQIRIPVPDVSREHCELLLESGALSVRDMGSSNGTFVNRARIESEQKHPLAAGDLLTVGGQTFVVRLNGEPERITAEMVKAAGADAASTSDSDDSGSPDSLLSEFSGEDASEESSVVDFDFDLSDDDENENQKGKL